LIAATGNYGFFNLLSIVLCASFLDDRDWNWLRKIVASRRKHTAIEAEIDREPSVAGYQWSMPRRVVVGTVGVIIVAVTTVEMLERIGPSRTLPGEIVSISRWVETLRSTNSYGLFAVMTTERPEIIVEGSNDKTSWKPYRFRWKACELDRHPMFATPHMPRLDWQLWFAALDGNCRSEPWFLKFERKLLEGSPDVLALLRENPFPDRPPRFVRARLELYKFTRWGSRDWWSRQDQGLFCPPLELKSFAAEPTDR
jgi:hypothetical protein